MLAKRVDQPLIHHSKQVLQYRLNLRQNLQIVIPHHPHATPAKPRIPTSIPSPSFGVEMLPAVHLDDQANRRRPEIHDERPQRPLPVKPDVAQSPATYVPP